MWFPSRLVTLVCAAVCGVALVAPRAHAADFTVNPDGTAAYIVNGVANRPLELVRGHTYTFQVSGQFVHPFFIKTARVTGPGSEYNNGVINNGAQDLGGLVTFTVPSNAPNPLFYQCSNHFAMGATITIVDPAVAVPAGGPLGRALLAAALAALGWSALRRSRRRA